MFGRRAQPAEPESRHARDVLQTRSELSPWLVDDSVVAAMSAVDLHQIRGVLEQHRVQEPHWNEQRDARYLNDSRVQHLAAGGYVFENLSVYMTMMQLLSPALARTNALVLDVGCGTGFGTMVLAHLVAPRDGHVVAIDLFERQVEHA